MQNTMKAVRVHAYGGSDALGIEELPTPTPEPGEVRVRVESVALNFRDIQMRRGNAPTSLPFTPGSDFAGHVDAVGAGVTHLREGDRVFGITLEGAYAQYLVADASRVFALPSDADLALASTLPIGGLTASFLVSSAGVTSSSTVVTWAAAGGLGTFIGGLLRRRGATSIGIVSTPEKAATATRAGFATTVTHSDNDVVAAVRSHTDGAGADVVFDSVGGPDFIRSFQLAADEGLVVLCGRSAGEPDLQSVQPELIGSQRALALRGFYLDTYITRHGHELPDRIAELFEAAAAGDLVVPITTFSLDDAAKAQHLLESGASSGKIVLHPFAQADAMTTTGSSS